MEGGLSELGSTLNIERSQAVGEPEEDLRVVREGPQGEFEKKDQRAETSWED